MKQFLLLALLPFLSVAQTQIGADLNGIAAGDNAGNSVAISADGSIVAVGNPQSDNNGADSGCVRIFKHIAGSWVQQGADINGEAAGDKSGSSVALSADGSFVAIGAPENNFNSGHVRIYKNTAGTWTQQGTDIDGGAYGDRSGWSISLSTDGTVAAIGSPYNTNNGNDSGIVRVYKLVNNAWSQMGNDINGWFYDAFGRSLSLSSNGNTIAIGSPYNSMNGAYTGRVRVFKLSAGVWTQEGADIRGINANEISGYSVSLSANGNTVAIGSIGNGTSVNSGCVRVFENIGGVWTMLGNLIPGVGTGDNSGRSISLSADGTVLAIGANMNAANGTGSGHVRIFKYASGGWEQRGINITGQAAGDNCGMSVALSSDGNTLVIGSPYNDVNGANAGQARVYDIAQLLGSDSFVYGNLGIYPNPANDSFNIHLPQDMLLEGVSLYNTLGQLVRKAAAHTVDVSQLAKGVYFVEVATDKGKATKSIIVE